MIALKPISSLEKCFMDESIEAKATVLRGCALRGEEYCFQLAYTSDEPGHYPKIRLYFSAETPFGDACTVSRVDPVPVRVPAFLDADDNYLRKTPGLYPDLLIPLRERDQIYVTYGELKSLFVSVRVPEDAVPGEYPVTVRFLGDGGVVVTEATFTLEVMAAVLPAQEMAVTQWFHYDCIASYYNLEVFSETHWAYIESFMRTAAANGINTILMPVFTPPLDTAIGHERPTVQLVDVYKTSEGYTFGFEKLDRWVALVEEIGFSHYEVAHLYTQWGAYHAPKVMGWENGEYKKLFGWETDSLSDEYKTFLRAFLSAFLAKMKSIPLSDGTAADRKCLFHISDEPYLDCLDTYNQARAQISDLLEGYTIMDALSNIEFYRSGAVAHPIPASNHIEPFLADHVPGLWTYYCCGQGVDVSNRFHAMPLARTRVIGTQFWKYRIAGFLQWGFNFWYSQGSDHAVDPYVNTDGDYFVPAGDTSSVYPGPAGQPYESLRLKGFTMALQDMRAMYAAEAKVGRDAVLAALEEGLDGEAYPRGITFAKYPHEAIWLLSVRDRINALLRD